MYRSSGKRKLLIRTTEAIRCSECAEQRSLQRLYSGSDVTFHNITGTGSLEWVSIHYTVNDPEGNVINHLMVLLHMLNQRFSSAGQVHILLNDEAVPVNLSDLNSRAGYHRTVPVQLRLREGDVNTIKLGLSGRSGMYSTFTGCQTSRSSLMR